MRCLTVDVLVKVQRDLIQQDALHQVIEPLCGNKVLLLKAQLI